MGKKSAIVVEFMEDEGLSNADHIKHQAFFKMTDGRLSGRELEGPGARETP